MLAADCERSQCRVLMRPQSELWFSPPTTSRKDTCTHLSPASAGLSNRKTSVHRSASTVECVKVLPSINSPTSLSDTCGCFSSFFLSFDTFECPHGCHGHTFSIIRCVWCTCVTLNRLDTIKGHRKKDHKLPFFCSFLLSVKYSALIEVSLFSSLIHKSASPLWFCCSQHT